MKCVYKIMVIATGTLLSVVRDFETGDGLI